jgi:nitrite reductase/ring-hydroxylating ferredoxin subunit
MRRVPELTEVSRREFCAVACGVALAGCFGDGGGAVQTGSLDGSDTTGPDASVLTDGGTTDGGIGATCSGTYFDVGAPASFVSNTPPKQFGSPNYFYVVRDANGLYALTSKCTHQGVVTKVVGSEFHCNQHGANFSFTGAVVNGPSNGPLQHFAMCTLANGNVGVQTSIKVDPSTRLVA